MWSVTINITSCFVLEIIRLLGLKTKKKTEIFRNWMFHSSGFKAAASLASLKGTSRSHVEKGQSWLGPQLFLKWVQKSIYVSI